jgi:menaquinone-dependent protoporphyrinogen oxidase
MNVWVISASKYGSTTEVAAVIAKRLEAANHQVRLLDAGEVDSFEAAGAVVLGSAIYAGHWLKQAGKLLDGHADELAARPTWLFSVGPLGDPPMPQDVGPEGISEAIQATHARAHEVFTGKLDRAAISRVERLMVRALHAPEGDFRDWDAIRGWGDAIAEELA